jgi:hypothetical protein
MMEDTSRMDPLSDEEVRKVLPALSEAARANEGTASRFVAPPGGIVELAAAKRHQFVLGRRGVGKSTLLRKVEENLRASNLAIVVFIDLESHKGIPYPDVLILLLIELFEELEKTMKLRSGAKSTKGRYGLWRARRKIRSVRNDFHSLLGEPQSAEVTVRKLRTKAKRWSIGGDLGLKGRFGQVRSGFSRDSSAKRDDSVKATFTQTKMDALSASVGVIRAVLAESMRQLKESTSFLVLDDFYHVPAADQAKVLSYLHQVVKNQSIYLKVCGVRHRLNPFVEGDPPMGLQIGQDADDISLDVTLENLLQAQNFLEAVLASVCHPIGVEVDQMLTDGGRIRLILGSGGVARDYLNLTRRALQRATVRSFNPSRPHNRITAEDVNEASAEMSLQKQDDLQRDSGANAEQLRQRLTSVVSFCLDHNETNVFLVEGIHLSEQSWGKEVMQLTDLRLLFQIGNVSVQSGEREYRGRRFVAFTLDLSNWTGSRSEKIRQIEFWTRNGKQELRRVGLIYEPDYEIARPTKAGTKDPVDWETPPLPGFKVEES